MSKITSVHARQILDSRGFPTVEVDVVTGIGLFRAAVPSGASTGIHEAVELRDGNKGQYGGKGVLNAVNNVNSVIAPKLIGAEVLNQAGIDKLLVDLDGTPNKGKLGANAILAVSMGVARAAAAFKGIPLYRYIAELAGTKQIRLPVPCLNVINGGKHAGNLLPVQEYMIAPAGATSFSEAIRYGSEIYQALKGIIKARWGLDATNVGDEGGFAPPVNDIFEPLAVLVEAIEKAGYTGKVKICLDAAASEFEGEDGKAPKGKYNLNPKGKDAPKIITGEELTQKYVEMVQKYPVVSIEDPFEQDDFTNFANLTSSLQANKVQVVGDDLTVTNVKRIQTAIENKSANALLLKVNQIGSVTEAIDAAKLAFANGWSVMVSHRSGETEDTFIADLTVGLGTGQLKSGAPCRSERNAKYNQLLRIEEELGPSAVYGYDPWK